ncbi:pentapeptide repeat-containing protein [Stappia sp. ES.058]|uniref:pentapeptide repeat-containing protein n=1 Tax=Stappia sp. ES.058 TaxID=1881061 RepID=UPI0008795C6D|nr:pentapeptide repeat-containing protein [Stappia sp. ES.058]SDU41276.1 Uncharacterized protein YjbI, contains pentapeptide repeats [Stappia sp. ES.058]
MLRSVKTTLRRGDAPPEIAPYRDAVNLAASRLRGLWVGYTLLLAYLFISVGAVTHRDLLLETPVTLPVLNVDLPLVGFFAVAPVFLVINQFYLLLQLFGLGRRVADFNEVLERQNLRPNEEHTERRRLDPFLIVQMLGGTKDEQVGQTSRFLRAIATITLVIAPLALLLFFQLQFLPYQSESVTWLHRIALLVSVAMLWLFWPSIRLGRWMPWQAKPLRALGAVTILASSFLIATFPGEFADGGTDAKNWTRPQDSWFATAKATVFGHIPGYSQRTAMLPFHRALQLPDNRTLIDLDAFDKIRERAKTYKPDASPWETDRTLSLRGRNLRGANFARSDLRNVDFFEARLRGASLRSASLQGASLHRASLQGASLNFARLQGASLHRASLQGASLFGANLQGASLDFAGLQAASLDRAHLQGASLEYASLQGASLFEARLQGASLLGANLQGASLDGASLQGASLIGAGLQGASLDKASLQGASLRSASLQAASLDRAKLWRTLGTIETDDLSGLWVANPDTRPLADDAFADLLENALKGVEDDTVRTRIRERLAPLSAPEAPPDSLPPRFWQDRIDRIDLGDHQTQLAGTLSNLACEADNAPYVAQGLIGRNTVFAWYSRLDDVGREHLPRVARRLLDAAEGRTTDCPGAVGLNAKAIAKLREWAGPLPGDTKSADIE